jgi:hypothetical protein
MSLMCAHQCGDCGLLYECDRKYCSRPFFCSYLHDCRGLLYSARLQLKRSDIIYLLHRRDINKNQYKMVDDRIIEHLNKVNDLR